MRAPSRIKVPGYDLIDIACVAVSVAVAVAVAVNERSAFRAVVAVAFSLFIPGRAVVSNWPTLAVRPHVALSIVFSLSILTFVSTVTLWLNYWRPLGLLEVESGVVVVALFVALGRRRRDEQRRTSPTEDPTEELRDPTEAEA
jgi:uncharacterized membrane protein